MTEKITASGVNRPMVLSAFGRSPLPVWRLLRYHVFLIQGFVRNVQRERKTRQAILLHRKRAVMIEARE